jgi:hypothetical protein
MTQSANLAVAEDGSIHVANTPSLHLVRQEAPQVRVFAWATVRQPVMCHGSWSTPKRFQRMNRSTERLGSRGLSHDD